MKTAAQKIYIILGLLLSFNLSAQQGTWTHYYRDLTVNDYLEVDNNLWLATDKGLFKVNKSNSNTTHYHKGNSVIPDNHIQTLSKDQTGNLWIGTYDFAMIKVPANGSTWSTIDYPTLLNNVIVYSSEVAPNGDVWLGCNQGLLQYDGQTWTQYPLNCSYSGSIPVWDLTINSEGKVFAGSFNLYTLENGQCDEYPTDTIILSAYGDAIMHMENDTTVWYLTDQTFLRKFDGHTWENLNVHTDLPIPVAFQFQKLMHNANGDLTYLGYDNLMASYSNGQWKVDSSLQQIAPSDFDYASGAYFDGNNDFWAFSRHQVLHQNATGATVQNLVDVYPTYIFYETYQDRNGEVYTSHYNEGIYHIDGSTWTKEIMDPSVGAFRSLAFDAENEKWVIAEINDVLTVLEEQGTGWVMHDQSSTGGILPTDVSIYNFEITNDNRVWILDENDNIYQYYNGVWSIENYVTTDAYTSDFTSDADGNIFWVESMGFGAGRNLKKFDGTTVQSYALPQGEGMLVQPKFDADGNLWMAATNGNLYKFDGTNFSMINYASSTVRTQSIIIDEDRMFVGTADDGIYHFDGVAWTHITETNSELSDNEIRGLVLDNQNRLWIHSAWQVLDLWEMADLSTSVQDVANESNPFLAYPNPVQNELNITINLKEEATMELFDMNGRLLHSSTTEHSTQTINMESMPAGAYLLRVKNEEKSYQQVVIKK